MNVSKLKGGIPGGAQGPRVHKLMKESNDSKYKGKVSLLLAQDQETSVRPVGGEVVDLLAPGQAGVEAHGSQVGRNTLPGGQEHQAVHLLGLHEVEEGVFEHGVKTSHQTELPELGLEGGELQVWLIKCFRFRSEKIFLVVHSNNFSLPRIY